MVYFACLCVWFGCYLYCLWLVILSVIRLYTLVGVVAVGLFCLGCMLFDFLFVVWCFGYLVGAGWMLNYLDVAFY